MGRDGSGRACKIGATGMCIRLPSSHKGASRPPHHRSRCPMSAAHLTAVCQTRSFRLVFGRSFFPQILSLRSSQSRPTLLPASSRLRSWTLTTRYAAPLPWRQVDAPLCANHSPSHAGEDLFIWRPCDPHILESGSAEQWRPGSWSMREVTAMRTLLLHTVMAAAVVLGFIVAGVQASAAPTTGATPPGAVTYYDDGFNAGRPTPGPTDPNGPSG
jgi:hypothetical protein